MSVERPKAVTVSFTVEPGSLWTDGDGNRWRVAGMGAWSAQLERPVSREVRYHDLVREYEPVE